MNDDEIKSLQERLLLCESETSEIKDALLRMFEADNAYGCGFYSDDTWRDAYLDLQNLVNCKLETAVYP